MWNWRILSLHCGTSWLSPSSSWAGCEGSWVVCQGKARPDGLFGQQRVGSGLWLKSFWVRRCLGRQVSQLHWCAPDRNFSRLPAVTPQGVGCLCC
jgi:hypothetical protein